MTDQLDDDVAADVDALVDSAQPTGKRKRVSRWDRPPEPHDWRFFVGGLGKILITIGLLMFGFVAYQLWGTGIETARAQNKLENEFDEMIAANQSLSEPSTTTIEVGTTPSTVAPDTTTPTSVEPSTDVSEATTPPTTVPAATDTTLPAVVQDIPTIERGDPIAKLEIPRMGKTGGDSLFVVPGVSHEDLKDGPGHYPDTPLPGQLGNASIAGHRTTFGEPFYDIDKLEPGDEIIVTMITGDRFVYSVTSTEIVGPEDYYVVTTTDPTVAQLTLTSCHPKFTAKQRIVVHATLVPDESAPVGVATYYDLEQGSDRGGNESVVTNPDASTNTDVSSSDVTAASAEESADASVDVGDGFSTTPAADGGEAFEGGWFDDSDAWPQIALWGAALIAIALAFRWLSRRFRSYLIGTVICVVPFVICLYFFYQNVNRLLPPGL